LISTLRSSAEYADQISKVAATLPDEDQITV